MAEEIKNVFVSHVHEDDAGLEKIKNLLAKKGMNIRDSSIHSAKPNNAKSPDYIKSILADQIDWAGTVIVYVTLGTKDSNWVNWEIERAHKDGKRIVGVWAYGDNDCKVPDALAKYADAVVGWNGERIVDAINGKINGWENPDGTQCEPRQILRYKC
jgi:hypothetical protein